MSRQRRGSRGYYPSKQWQTNNKKMVQIKSRNQKMNRKNLFILIYFHLSYFWYFIFISFLFFYFWLSFSVWCFWCFRFFSFSFFSFFEWFENTNQSYYFIPYSCSQLKFRNYKPHNEDLHSLIVEKKQLQTIENEVVEIKSQKKEELVEKEKIVWILFLISFLILL